MARAIARGNDAGAMALALAGACCPERGRRGFWASTPLSKVAREMEMPRFANFCLARGEARELAKSTPKPVGRPRSSRI